MKIRICLAVHIDLDPYFVLRACLLEERQAACTVEVRGRDKQGGQGCCVSGAHVLQVVDLLVDLESAKLAEKAAEPGAAHAKSQRLVIAVIALPRNSVYCSRLKWNRPPRALSGCLSGPQRSQLQGVTGWLALASH